LRYFILIFLGLSLGACSVSQESEERINNQTDTLFQFFTDSIIDADSYKVKRNLTKFSLQLTPTKTDYQKIILELSNIYALKESNNLDSAINRFEGISSELRFSNNDRFKRKLLDVDLTLGIIFLYSINDMEQALPKFLEAKSLSESVGNIFQKAEVNKYLGYVYFRQSNAASARESFEDALNVYYEIASKTRPNHYVIQEQIGNIGLCYYASSDYKNAVVYFDSALTYLNHKMDDFNDENAKELAISIIEGNKARSLIRLNKKDEALILLRKNFKRKINDKRYMENAITEYFAITRLRLEDSPNSAKLFLDTLENLVAQKPRVDVVQKLERLKGRYYETFDLKKAIAIYKKQMAIKDSTYNAFTEMNLKSKLDDQAALESKLKIAIAQKEIKSKESQSKILLVFSIFSFLFLIGLSYVILRFKNKNKDLEKLNTRIIQQKETIDISLKKLQTTNNKLNEVNGLKTGILGIVAHDLKNPFDAIDSTISLIREEKDISPKELEELLGLVKLSTETANNIISELIIYSQLEQKGNQIINLSFCDSSEIIKRALFMNKLKAKEKNIKIEFDNNIRSRLNLDNDRMVRVFNNLISNAIKFSERNTTLKINTQETSQDATFVISDEGVGIPKELLSILFEPFSNARRNGTDGERSTGLGLSIVKKIIDGHNGIIKVNTTEGKGTCITITIPKNFTSA